MRDLVVLHLAALLVPCISSVEAPEEELPIQAPPPIDFLAQDLNFEASRPPANLPAWVGNKAQCDLMVAEGVAWAACNGVMMRTPRSKGDGESESGGGSQG